MGVPSRLLWRCAYVESSWSRLGFNVISGIDKIDGMDGCRIYIDAHRLISTAFGPANNNAL